MDIAFTAYPVRPDDMKLAQTDPLAYVQMHELVDFDAPPRRGRAIDYRPGFGFDGFDATSPFGEWLRPCSESAQDHPENPALRLGADWESLDVLFSHLRLPDQHPGRRLLQPGRRSGRKVACTCSFSVFAPADVAEVSRALESIARDDVSRMIRLVSDDDRPVLSGSWSGRSFDGEAVTTALERTVSFVSGVARASRGLVVRIG